MPDHDEALESLKEALRNALHPRTESDIDFDGIAGKFTDYLHDHMPSGTAVVFGFARDRDRIMCVIGGQNVDSPVYDALLVKLGAQIDGRREFTCTEGEVDIERAGDGEDS
jgi:hypothetical protein